MTPKPFDLLGKAMTIPKRVLDKLREKPAEPEASSVPIPRATEEEEEDEGHEPTEQELSWQTAYQIAAYHAAYAITWKVLRQTHPDDTDRAALVAHMEAIRDAGEEMERIAWDPRRDPQWSRRAMRPYLARSAAKGVRVLLIDELEMREFRADVRAGHWEGMQELLDAELGPDPGVKKVDARDVWVNGESGEEGEQTWWNERAREMAWRKAGDADAEKVIGEAIKSATTSRLEDMRASVGAAHYSLRSFKRIVEARARLVRETSDFVWISGQEAET
jgi:hypothetical protein